MIKLQTLLIYENGDIALRIDDMIYQPVDSIMIEGVVYTHWSQYDEYADGYLVRNIHLTEIKHKVEVQKESANMPTKYNRRNRADYSMMDTV